MSQAQPLHVKDIAVHLGGRQVLHDTTVSVEPGKIHALLGPNGAGKTTLLRALLGLIPLAGGKVETHSQTLGYVPQRQDMNWDYPVNAQDVVELGLVKKLGLFGSKKSEDRQAVADALNRVRMAELRHRPIGEMSGGQRQRVMIARALVLRPVALLLDEPFTGLDMPSQELLSGLFRDLADEGCAVLLSTHDLTHALDVADHVTLLNRTVIASGPTEQILETRLWQQTFQVSDSSPVLKQIQALTHARSHPHHLTNI